jgi:hypothetical protein
LVITETELRPIAAAAIISDNRLPKNGVQHTCGNLHHRRVVNESKEQVLPDIAHGGPA